MFRSRCVVEVLESRIAPAMLFLSGQPGDKVVRDANGNTLSGDVAAAATAGADLALLMSKGDALVYDANGNHAVDSGELTLVSVTAGKALVFVTDFSNGGNGGADGKFEQNEITGLAVSDAFAAKINTDINGSIVTALDDTDHLSTNANGKIVVLASTIDGLNIDGQVVGNIFSGKTMSDIFITGQHFNTGSDIRSVTGNLATGTAIVNNDVHMKPDDLSFDGGGTTLKMTPFVPRAGSAGGSITNVRLDHGAHNLLAGDGGDNNTNVPGGGGKIVNVAITMDSADPVWLVAGNGGNSSTALAANGGSISDVNVKIAFANPSAGATDDFFVKAGSGGKSGGSGSGGAGGSILDSNFTSGVSFVSNGFIISAGSGGDAGGNGTAGAGGSVSNTTIQALGAGETVKDFFVTGGVGGASTSGHGGTGGGVLNDTISMEADVTHSFEISSGDGGTGKTFGGAGGALTSDNILLHGMIANPALIESGNGGDLLSTAGAGAIAGRGGAITSLNISGLVDLGSSKTPGALNLTSGNGGSAAAAAHGTGGTGGLITLANIDIFAGDNTDLSVKAGDGGEAAATTINSKTASGTGGAGGSVTKSSLTITGSLKSLTLKSGAGGASNVNGPGGAGGALGAIGVLTKDVSGSVLVTTGAAGASVGHKGASGGAISTLDFENTGAVANAIQFLSGAGSAVTGTGAGGNGGAISHLTLTNIGGATGAVVNTVTIPAVNIVTGEGGKSAQSTGGAGGLLTRLVLHNFSTLSDIAFDTGIGGDGSTGGPGGSITSATLFDTTGGITFPLIAGAGGKSASGHGGNGGAINGLAVSAFESTVNLFAGNGGDGGGKSSAGAGGAVANIIGAVNLALLKAGGGGNNANGTGGSGGSIHSIDLDPVAQFVRSLKAGNGGNGAKAGGGGSVTDVTVAGDIGDFTSDFDVVADTTGMGGIVAGEKGTGTGGTNGSITHITADRIAAMIAGTPAANAVTAANAVQKISSIVANVIGADLNGNNTFDFTEGGSDAIYQPPETTDGDTALDGLVIVRLSGNGALPVVPLKLITIA